MANITVDESDGSVQIPVRPFSTAATDIVVNYTIEQFTTNAVADATITGMGADISDPNSGTVTIPTGTSAAMPHHITINIIDDITAEPQEDFRLRLTSVSTSGYQIGGSLMSARVFINDNDNQPTFAIAVDDADTAEGDTAVFTVTLGGTAPGTTVTVDWAVSGSASASDYTVSGADTDGTLSFTALGNQTLNFAITDDSAQEPAETLTVTLRNASSGSVIGTASATTTIAASDQPLAHSFAFTNPAATITEGAAATTFTVTRTGPAIAAAAGITVTWAYAAASPAPVAADFHNDTLPAGGTLEFTGTETSETFTITTAEDTLNEAGERFTLSLSIAAAHQAAATAEGGADATASHTVTITDDDPVTVAITRASGSGAVGEGSGALSFTVTVAGGTRASGVDTIVPFSVTGLTAGEFDITAPTPAPAASATSHSITIAHGSSTGTLTLTLQDDDLNEAQETLTITGGAVGAAGLRLTGAGAGAVEYTGGGNTASVNVTDTDAITVSIAAPSPAEVDEGRVAEFTVSFAGAASGAAGPIEVAYSVAWTATSTGTFTDLTGSPLTIAAGQSGGTIRVRIDNSAALDDNSPDETLRVTLGAITPGAGAGSATGSGMADVTVDWKTAARTLTVTGPATIAENGDRGGVESGNYTITLAGRAFSSATTVTWTVTHGTTEDADFVDRGGMVTFGPGDSDGSAKTFTLAIANDDRNEAGETFTVQAGVMDATADGITAFGAAHTTTITDDDAIDGMSMTLRGPTTVNEGRSYEYTVDVGAEVTGSAVTVAITTGGTATVTTDYTLSETSIDIAPGARSEKFMLTTTNGGGDNTPDRTLELTLTATGGANTAAMAAITRTITITEDDPAARAVRLEAPLASAGRGVGQLAAQAVAGRLAAVVGGANSLTVAGRNIADSETLAAEYLAGGYATGDADISTVELLRRSSFNLAGGDGGRGFNFWGSGEYVSAEGDHDGIDYDGSASAFHLGVDAAWRDGLIGVAIGRSAGDTDFTVNADGMKSTLETTVTSVHPYLTRRLNRAQLWLTAGHGSGDAELKEPGATIKTDLTVTTAAFGITHAQDELFTAGVSALYTRAELDSAQAGGRALPKTATNALRIKAEAEAGWTRDNLRPFLTFALRHDAGDGDTGGAADLGGGVEWSTPAASLRLAGTTHLTGGGAEEKRLNLTARKTAGRLNLGLTVGMEDGLNTANLLSGEWQF